MDNYAKVPTPCDVDGNHLPTIKTGIQETRKIMIEMRAVLDEFASIVNGQRQEDKTPKDASSLWDEAQILTTLAYDNLQKLNEIKNSII